MDKITLEDTSVMLGFSSLPVGKENETEETIKSIFLDYKKKILKNVIGFAECHPNDEPCEFSESILEPKFYYIFGKFDLCVLSLIDDSQFPLGNFRPQYPSENLSELFPFNRLVSFGPIIDYKEEVHPFKEFQEILNQDFLPLISISQIKISDVFLFSEGIEGLSSVCKAIDAKILKRKNEGKDDCKYLILCNYAWNELTLILFTSGYNIACDILMSLRSISASEVPFASTLIHNIIETTTTSFGFDFEIFKYISNNKSSKGEKLLNNIKKQSFQFRCRWQVKPGSLTQILDIFSEIAHQQELILCSSQVINITAGRGDVIFPYCSEPNNSSVFLIDAFIKTLCSIRKDNRVLNLISDVSTFISRVGDEKIIKEEGPYRNHLNEISKIKSQFLFSDKEIIHLDNALQNLLVPDILRKAIRSILTIYNNGLKDCLTFSSFLDFHPFLKSLKNKADELNVQIIENPSVDIELDKVHETLDRMVHSFYYAYQNRLNSSYLTGEIYEFNIFFDGGIHQLLTSFSGAHKTISKYFGNENNFLFVEGDPRFSTSDWALRLNSYHLFNPEKLASVIFPEVIHQFHCKFKDPKEVILFFFHSKIHDDAQKRIDLNIAKNGIPNRVLDEYDDFFSILTPELFEHLYSDILSFVLFYLKDLNLFRYWSFGYWSTNSYIYNIKNKKYKIADQFYLTFLFRHLIIIKYFFPEDFDKYQFSFSPEMDDLFLKYSSKMKKFINEVLSVGNINDWFLWTIKMTESIFLSVYTSSLAQYSESSKGTIEEYKRKLSQGEVIITNCFDFSEEGCKSALDLIKIQQLFYAFISLVKDLSNSTPDNNNVLRRDFFPEPVGDSKSNSRSYRFKSNDANIMFDPSGGIFVANLSLKRKLLKARFSFHYSLWDFSQKLRGSYIGMFKI